MKRGLEGRNLEKYFTPFSAFQGISYINIHCLWLRGNSRVEYFTLCNEYNYPRIIEFTKMTKQR